jgi:hypothetical protein
MRTSGGERNRTRKVLKMLRRIQHQRTAFCNTNRAYNPKGLAYNPKGLCARLSRTHRLLKSRYLSARRSDNVHTFNFDRSKPSCEIKRKFARIDQGRSGLHMIFEVLWLRKISLFADHLSATEHFTGEVCGFFRRHWAGYAPLSRASFSLSRKGVFGSVSESLNLQQD